MEPTKTKTKFNEIDFTPITSSKIYTQKSSLELDKNGFQLSALLKHVATSLANNLDKPLEWTTEVDKSFSAFAQKNNFNYSHSENKFIDFEMNDYLKINTLSLPNPNWKLNIIKNLNGRFNNLDFDYYCGLVQEGGVVNCFQINLSTPIPRLLVSLRQNIDSEIELILKDLSQYEERSLEGDFSKTYRVYAEKNDKLTAHYILSPEVMELLIENKIFDIWINENYMSIYTRFPTFQPYLEYITDFFKFTEILLSNIDAISKLK